MTVWLRAWMVPQCQPVVEPDRQMEDPRVAWLEPRTVTEPPA
ncbi:hypothetical protein [Streptomonospora mangrovi]